MGKLWSEALPTYDDATTAATPRPWLHRRQKRKALRIFGAAALTYLAYTTFKIANNTEPPVSTLSIAKLQQDHAVCASLRQQPVESSAHRDHNKRWVKSTKPVLIRNATIWTGEPAAGTPEEDARAGKGWGWVASDVFIDKGLIVTVQPSIKHGDLPHDTEIFDAKGRQLTAGIVDMHSHAGLESLGNLQSDDNELSSDITPYVRSLDGIDPLQPEFESIKSGGVTTSLFLPGSGNNIGGEAFVLKFAVGLKNGRAEISQQDLFADPDRTWRYLKMACEKIRSESTEKLANVVRLADWEKRGNSATRLSKLEPMYKSRMIGVRKLMPLVSTGWSRTSAKICNGRHLVPC